MGSARTKFPPFLRRDGDFTFCGLHAAFVRLLSCAATTFFPCFLVFLLLAEAPFFFSRFFLVSIHYYYYYYYYYYHHHRTDGQSPISRKLVSGCFVFVRVVAFYLVLIYQSYLIALFSLMAEKKIQNFGRREKLQCCSQ